jgi:hypothetical protein
MKLPLKSSYQFTQSKFKRGKITCPACGNTHRWHCSVTEDEGLALCKNKCSEQRSSDGRYIHIMSKSEPVSSKSLQVSSLGTIQTDKQAEPQIADDETLDLVYSILLSHLRLTPKHAHILLDGRGLGDDTIARKLYASVPSKAKGNRLARAMQKKGVGLNGVPGFYCEDKRWKLNTRLPGYYVPYRNEAGKITGLQIRRDDNADPKYVWLSSRSLPNGTPASSCLHFVNADIVELNGEVLITEGALKADAISEFIETPTIAVPGVTAINPEKFACRIKEAYPKLRQVTVAFDIDWKTNEHVRDALLRLVNALKTNEFVVRIRQWHEDTGKGFDDVLRRAQGGKA